MKFKAFIPVCLFAALITQSVQGSSASARKTKEVCVSVYGLDGESIIAIETESGTNKKTEKVYHGDTSFPVRLTEGLRSSYQAHLAFLSETRNGYVTQFGLVKLGLRDRGPLKKASLSIAIEPKAGSDYLKAAENIVPQYMAMSESVGDAIGFSYLANPRNSGNGPYVNKLRLRVRNGKCGEFSSQSE